MNLLPGLKNKLYKNRNLNNFITLHYQHNYNRYEITITCDQVFIIILNYKPKIFN